MSDKQHAQNQGWNTLGKSSVIVNEYRNFDLNARL